MEKDPKAATENPIMDLLNDDEEFEEFDINKVWVDKEEEKELTKRWEDDWDVVDPNDDFSMQLKRELQNSSEKS